MAASIQKASSSAKYMRKIATCANTEHRRSVRTEGITSARVADATLAGAASRHTGSRHTRSKDVPESPCPACSPPEREEYRDTWPESKSLCFGTGTQLSAQGSRQAYCEADSG